MASLSTEASAQTITLKNSKANSCQYTSLILTTGGNIEVECAQVTSGGQINFSPASATVTSTAPVAVTVTRSGNFGGDTSASAEFSCSSPAAFTASILPAASGQLNFYGNSSAGFTILPGTLPAGVVSSKVICTLRSTSNNAELGPSSVYELTVAGISSSPGSIAFTSATSSITAGGPAVGITVARTGSTAGTPAAVTFSCTTNVSGYAPAIAPAATGTLSFTGDESKLISVTPGTLPNNATAAIVTCTLSNPSGGATLGSNTSHALTVTGSGGGSGNVNCTPGAVAQSLDLSSNDVESKIDITLQNGETAAVAFKPTRFSFSRLKSLIYWSLHAPPPYDGWQASISLCPGAVYDAIPPGNEAAPNNCKVMDKSNEGVLDISTEAPFQAYECILQRDRIYYLNVRWVNPQTGGPGCPSGTCGMRNALNYR